jgi:hypothetical protein
MKSSTERSMSNPGSLNTRPNNSWKNSKASDMNYKNSERLNRLLFYGVKTPGIYLLMITGILLDLLIQFPFIVICALENLFHRAD